MWLRELCSHGPFRSGLRCYITSPPLAANRCAELNHSAQDAMVTPFVSQGELHVGTPPVISR